MTLIKILTSFLLLSCIIGNVNAGYLDDWPDEALCGWLDSASPPEHIIEEANKRGISCPGEVASKHLIENVQSSSTPSIEIYDIIFSDEILQELLEISPEERASDFTRNFKNYRLAFIQDEIICGFNLKRVVYENKAEGEIESWDMAYGSITFRGLLTDFKGAWSKSMGGLSSDSRYFNDEINIKLTKDGHLVGKMAYFTHTIASDEAPRRPLFIELRKHPKTKPLNYKNINLDNSAEFWIDVEDWAGGIMYVFNCKDNEELQKNKSAKEKAEKLYKDSLAKNKMELKLIGQIYESKVAGPDIVFSINYLDGVFGAKSTPKDSKKLHDDELHKAHINGIINTGSLDQSIGLKTLVSMRENDNQLTLVVSVAEDEDVQMDPLKEFAKPAIEYCGKLPGFWWDKLSFVVSTTDIEIAKKQKCYFDFFNNRTNSKAKNLYRAILSASSSITYYLKSNVDR